MSENDPEGLVLPRSLSVRFADVQFIGAGGMGAVYRAKDRQLGRDVAIKILHQADPETNRMLLREARALARLDHENVCKVYEVEAESERPFILMQYIAGESLGSACKRLTLEEKVRVIQQIALALHEAHRLGIIHRDVKPENIMIEYGEDGLRKPYIMDFGIAREIGNLTQTMNAFAGTPSYMAPEQATGDVSVLDRRTDVYSLGATLYDVLSGQAPFVGSNPMAILQKVVSEEPTPLRNARGDVPFDLDAVVLKCLDKEPGQRYESARALAEDLQRFLDGTPVTARRPSPVYVLYKAAKRHKVRVAMAALFVAVFSIFAILWIREQRVKAEQAAISRELGEDLKEMELFLSRAYGLPLHDIERERRIIHDQLSDIETRMGLLGRSAEGPGHYALGRGYLALEEFPRALGHLRRAEAAGYSPPELRYAMGLVLVEMYVEALEETKRIQDIRRREERIATLDAEYKEPALGHLRAALGARLSSPAYVEGLIALHEGRYDEAREKARQAFEQSPWLYEAKKLEGDAFFSEGKRYGRDAAFDDDKMMALFEPAAAAYAEAAVIARSDPLVHEAECEVWTQILAASDVRPKRLRASFDKAKNACEKAIAADSERISARLKLQLAQNIFAWNARNGLETEDPETIIRAAVGQAEVISERWVTDAMAQYLVGSANRTALVYFIGRGLDPRTSIERAIAAYERAIDLDPTFLWPYNEVCASYCERSVNEIARGIDPTNSVERAVARCDGAISLDPSFTLPAISKAFAYFQQAQYLAEKGRSPERSLVLALETATTVKDKNPIDASTVSVWALLLRAMYETESGKDPEATLGQVEALLREKKQLESSLSEDEQDGLVAKTRAAHWLRQGKDPTSETAKARLVFKTLVTSSPQDVDYRINWARTEIIELRWLDTQGKLKEESFNAALAPLVPLLDRDRANPNIYAVLAEIHALRAKYFLQKNQNIEIELKIGQTMVEKALALNPSMATALAAKGTLFFLAARQAHEDGAKRNAATKAKEALSAAVAENPLLASELNKKLAEVAPILAVN